MAFEDAPGVLGTSIRTLRKEALKAYATESLGAVALGLEDIRLSPVNKNGLIALNLGEQIEFAFNSSAIPKKSRRLLDGIGRLLAENPDTQVQIFAHTDDQGDSGYNRRLSQRRADAIRDYLISRGVAQTRIAATGRGEDAPLVETGSRAPTRAERARNRRTELLIEPLEIAEDAQEPSENPETEPVDTLGESQAEQPDDSANLP
ncbi:MAG: OmpA family protein [Chromatiaceae bacterium]